MKREASFTQALVGAASAASFSSTPGIAEELAAEAAPRKAKPRLGGAFVWPDLQHEPAREDAPDKEQRHQRPGDQLHALGAVASGAAQCHPQGERDDRIAILEQQRRGGAADRERIEQQGLRKRASAESDRKS